MRNREVCPGPGSVLSGPVGPWVLDGSTARRCVHGRYTACSPGRDGHTMGGSRPAPAGPCGQGAEPVSSCLVGPGSAASSGKEQGWDLSKTWAGSQLGEKERWKVLEEHLGSVVTKEKEMKSFQGAQGGELFTDFSASGFGKLLVHFIVLI